MSCSPADDRYLRKGQGGKKAKCRDCPVCQKGTGRNLTMTDTERRNLDNTQCLPCEECRPGTFNDCQRFTNECHACSTNKCGSLFRNVHIQCSSTHDVICGSCKPGYFDCEGSVLFKCCPSPTVTPRPQLSHEPLSVKATPSSSSENGQFGNVNAISIIPIIGILSGILLVILIMAIIMRRPRPCPRNTKNAIADGKCLKSDSTLSSTSENSSLISGSDDTHVIEMDGPSGSSVKQKYAHNHVQFASPELESLQQSTFGGKPVNNETKEIQSQIQKEKCGCSPGQCSEACKASVYDSVIANKNDALLVDISKGICHDETAMIECLQINYSEVYNLESNRNRAPDKFTEHEFVLQVLQRWVEIRGPNALYRYLRKALCDGGFHRINAKCFGKP